MYRYMGVSQSMIDSIIKACECVNHLKINCKSTCFSIDVDTNDVTTLDSLPSMNRIGSKASVASVLSSNEDENENENMDSFKTLPPPGHSEFITTNEHNHHKVLTNIK